MVLGHTPPEKEHVVVTLDEEGNDDEESSVHVRCQTCCTMVPRAC
jgi:hypothetical protein